MVAVLHTIFVGLGLRVYTRLPSMLLGEKQPLYIIVWGHEREVIIHGSIYCIEIPRIQQASCWSVASKNRI